MRQIPISKGIARGKVSSHVQGPAILNYRTLAGRYRNAQSSIPQLELDQRTPSNRLKPLGSGLRGWNPSPLEARRSARTADSSAPEPLVVCCIAAPFHFYHPPGRSNWRARFIKSLPSRLPPDSPDYPFNPTPALAPTWASGTLPRPASAHPLADNTKAIQFSRSRRLPFPPNRPANWTENSGDKMIALPASPNLDLPKQGTIAEARQFREITFPLVKPTSTPPILREHLPFWHNHRNDDWAATPTIRFFWAKASQLAKKDLMEIQHVYWLDSPSFDTEWRIS